MATTAVTKPKWDSKGNLIKSAGSKGRAAMRRFKVSVPALIKAEGMYMVSGALGGGVAVGVASAVASRFLPSWYGAGGIRRFAVVGLPALGIAGLELVVLAKVTTPRNAKATAPYLIGATVVIAAAPMLAVEVVERIDALMARALNSLPGLPAASASGTGPVPHMRARRVLTPDQVIMAQKASMQQQQPVSARRGWR